MQLRTLNDSDGTIINTSEAYESVFIETLRSWLDEFNKDFYSVGPTIPLDFNAGELKFESHNQSGQLQNGEVNKERNASQAEVELFLDNALEKYGKESVIFVRGLVSPCILAPDIALLQISFGSTFWPKDPAFVEEILNVLIEKDFPFVCLPMLNSFHLVRISSVPMIQIFAYGSPAAKLPDDLKSSPKGLLAKWVPQQYILNHPVGVACIAWLEHY